ncbi:diacylglycerol kinase [methane-oxidizing endosymbiont of Gigantopelta aegis]|uniref:diacylglycerol kinase n=1 Tax=methane-oxidizing endosymbiont of Gigantopelta aegis TaxID=2794938 RepID=UPI0018DC2F6C|nr:diacylglycerol kinase [methane-oxidizing endosymbiont of Gigantopelta aegis]
MANQEHKGLRRIWNAFFFSLSGFKAVWQHEEAFRQELLLSVLMAPVAIWLGETIEDRLILLSCLFLVLIVELLNSAIEAVVDRVGLEHHELSGRAKDIGSAAVFLSLTWTVIVWVSILIL